MFKRIMLAAVIATSASAASAQGLELGALLSGASTATLIIGGIATLVVIDAVTSTP